MSVHAQAEPAPPINIPASDLVTALDNLARQSGAQFIYRADQLRGARTRGVRGNLPADAAPAELLAGTGYVPGPAASGAGILRHGRHTPPAGPRPGRKSR